MFRTPVQTAGAVLLYVSDETVIVAAMHSNVAGIYYEQPSPAVLRWPFEAMELGAAFRDAFSRCSVKDADLRQWKRSDWPSFQTSGVRSLKEFDRQYVKVDCFACNASNAVVRASAPHPVHADVEVAVSFNPSMPPDVVGGHLMRVLEAAATGPWRMRE